MGISPNKAILPPQADQIEITLIGPGYGETILVHLGNNKWVVVDSCIDSRTSEPAALSYLHSIGVNPGTSVVLIIATHWHDDHVRGIAKTLESCPNARFCISSALTKEQFLCYVISFNEHNPIAAGSGVYELSQILSILQTSSPTKALMNRRVYSIPASESGHEQECSVWTLSPSDKQVDLFLSTLTKYMPKIKETKFRVTEPEDNLQSIVTLIEIGNLLILLGGDLMETTDPNMGWSVIVESAERPQGKACIYKVPHHGSKNAHSDDVWNKMLIRQPYAILTPFNRGASKIPTPSDVDRIGAFTSEGYSTSKISSISKSTIDRPPSVERTIRESVGKIRRIQPRTGMVRLRYTVGTSEPWSVELSENACKLIDMHS